MIGHTGGYDLLKKNSKFYFVQDQGQVQAQPGLQQVQVLREYSTFWPVNHFTW